MPRNNNNLVNHITVNVNSYNKNKGKGRSTRKSNPQKQYIPDSQRTNIISPPSMLVNNTPPGNYPQLGHIENMIQTIGNRQQQDQNHKDYLIAMENKLKQPSAMNEYLLEMARNKSINQSHNDSFDDGISEISTSTGLFPGYIPSNISRGGSESINYSNIPSFIDIDPESVNSSLSRGGSESIDYSNLPSFFDDDTLHSRRSNQLDYGNYPSHYIEASLATMKNPMLDNKDLQEPTEVELTDNTVPVDTYMDTARASPSVASSGSRRIASLDNDPEEVEAPFVTKKRGGRREGSGRKKGSKNNPPPPDQDLSLPGIIGQASSLKSSIFKRKYLNDFRKATTENKVFLINDLDARDNENLEILHLIAKEYGAKNSKTVKTLKKNIIKALEKNITV